MHTQPGPFIRLFNLPAAPEDDQLAQEVGKPFGPMHSSGQGGNPKITAGFSELKSSAQSVQDPARNFHAIQLRHAAFQPIAVDPGGGSVRF